MTEEEKAKERKHILKLVAMDLVVCVLAIGFLFFMTWAWLGKKKASFVFEPWMLALLGLAFLFMLIASLHNYRAKGGLKKRPMVIGRIVSVREATQSLPWVSSAGYGSHKVITVEFYTMAPERLTASYTTDHFCNPLGAASPGAPCPVRYLPEDPKKIIAGTEWVEGVDEKALEEAFEESSQEVRRGPLVSGSIVSLRDKAGRLGKRPIFETEVQFDTVEGDRISATIFRLISPEMRLSSFRPGERILLRYHPQSPERVMLFPLET